MLSVLKPFLGMLSALLVAQASVTFAQVVASNTSYANIVVRIVPLDSSLAPDLTEADFHLNAAGKKVRCKFLTPSNRNSVPSVMTTFVLVDLAGSTAISTAITNLSPIAKDLFSRGWKVSVLDPEGRQTPYESTQDELNRALATSGGAARSEISAIRSLSRNAGRHIVFSFRPSPSVDERLIAATNSVLGILYVVDPTFRREVRSREGDANLIQTLSGSGTVIASAVVSGGLLVSHPAAQTRPIYEPTFQSALQDAMTDGSQYYGLTTLRVSATQALKLDVVIPDQPASHFQVEAQSYSESGQPPSLFLGKN